jgi:hypothetical protein
MNVTSWQAVLYLTAVILLAVSALLAAHVTPTRVNLVVLAAALALLAFALPTMNAAW